MNTIKIILFSFIAVSLLACGSDSSNTNPTNPTPVAPVDNFDDDGDPIEPDDGDNNGGPITNGLVIEIKAKRTAIRNVDQDFDCDGDQNSGKISQQRRAQIFQRLCNRAGNKSEQRLANKCANRGGVLVQEPTFITDTFRTKEGSCRIFNCKVKATGLCGVQQ